jgi:hypothetical protein
MRERNKLNLRSHVVARRAKAGPDGTGPCALRSQAIRGGGELLDLLNLLRLRRHRVGRSHLPDVMADGRRQEKQHIKVNVAAPAGDLGAVLIAISAFGFKTHAQYLPSGWGCHNEGAYDPRPPLRHDPKVRGITEAISQILEGQDRLRAGPKKPKKTGLFAFFRALNQAGSFVERR